MAKVDGAAAAREAALDASGLPQCRWVEAWDAAHTNLRRDEFCALVKHMRSCAVCRARDRYIAERFPPIPQPHFVRILGAFLIVLARLVRR
jgi:hypothetical protein